MGEFLNDLFINYIQIKMNESITKQALPSEEYIKLLGIALCVFNSNNAFVIENILNNKGKHQYDWYNLIDTTSGSKKMETAIKNTITENSDDKIANLFEELCDKRNRIIHGFQITSNGEQILATKEKETNRQFIITEDYLIDFIKENDCLSTMLDEFRSFNPNCNHK